MSHQEDNIVLRQELRPELYYISTSKNLQLKPSKKWSFAYQGKKHVFNCALQQMKCLGQTKHNKQCNRNVVLTLPYCWQHLKRDLNLRIGQTKLKDAKGTRYNFLGLFACGTGQVFQESDIITPFIGQKMSYKQLKAKYGTAVIPYDVVVAGDKGEKHYDAACVRGVGALANMCTDKICPGNNADLRQAGFKGNYPVVMATKSIFDGDEILVDYDELYFAKGIKHRKHYTKPVNKYNSIQHKC